MAERNQPRTIPPDSRIAFGRARRYHCAMGEKRLGYAVGWAVVLGVWFSLIFYGADAITAQRLRYVPPHFAWELRLPFVPAFTIVYLSIHLLLAMAPMLLLTRRE